MQAMVLYSSLQVFNQFISASTVRELNINIHETHMCDYVCLEIVKTVHHDLEICTD